MTPAFNAVAEAFRDGTGTGGTALAVVANGRTVVDIWHGTADTEGRRPWEHDTIVNVFSVSKAALATAAHQLATRGLLDLEAPVRRYWPEFGGSATVA